MKTLLLLLCFGMTISTYASEVVTPEFCIVQYSTLLRHGNTPIEPSGIDYESIATKDPLWTKEKVLELLKSIDPKTVKFKKHDHLANEIWMVAPFEARFTFEPRTRKNNPGFLSSTIYWLVGVDTKPE